MLPCVPGARALPAMAGQPLLLAYSSSPSPSLSSTQPAAAPAAVFHGDVAGQASVRALCAASPGLPLTKTAEVLPLRAVRMCLGKPGPAASPSTLSFPSLLGSSETETVHQGLASTSPVMQYPTLPCIFSSVTLFFGCHSLAANVFVLVSPTDSPRGRNKK